MKDAIGFIGLGNMGFPMAGQLLQAGHPVRAFDTDKGTLERASAAGAVVAGSIAEAVAGANAIITMLPAGSHVREVYLCERGVIASAERGALLIDSSTIDMETSRAVGSAAAASESELEMIDAPVSGGIMAARTGRLNFIVGGAESAYRRAKPILDVMARKVFYAGEQGSGIGVKICNNMSLGISMIAASEALMMAKRLGLDVERAYEVMCNASGQNWALSSYCPLPGLLDGVPSNDEYKPGFTAEMMRKDLRLSQEAALSVNANTPLAAHALAIFSHFCDGGHSQTDFSGVSKLIGGDAWDYPFNPGKE